MLARGQITVTNLDDGIGVKGVTGYYLASPLSEGIRKDTPGWTTEMQPLTPENKYLWNKEIVHYTDNESALKDKTEVLSGEEIYTDKADADAVVHVEVDGKSYQHAGSGKNLIRDNTENIRIEALSGSPYANLNYSKKPELGKTYTFSLKGDLLENAKGWRIWMGSVHIGDFAKAEDVWTMRVVWNTTHEANYNNVFRVYPLSNDSTLPIKSFLHWIQLEEGSVATTYEPPAPTPDYPIEIHSLNDFDVVSSVGLNNQFLNTDFKKGTTYWNLGNSDGGTSGNEGYSIARARYGGLQQSVPHYESLRGHVLYGRVDLKSDSVSSYFVFFNDGFTQITRTVPSSEVGKFTTLSATSTVSNEARHLYCKIQDSRTEGWTESRIKNLYVLDLTEIYGKGNEPTQAEMDALFKDKWAPSVFDITEDGSSHPSIDKANILLSEPLRSVGDVKDRLFRDSDGLWKIERNVGEIILDGSRKYTTKVNDNPEYSSYYLSNSDIAVGAKMASSHYPFLEHSGTYVSREGQQIRNYSDTSASIMITDYTMTHAQFQNKLRNSPVTVIYEKRNTEIETLSQADQDKLNNITSYKDFNYLYTIVDKTNILPNYVSENLKPNLHATFKSKAWSGNNAGYPSVIGVYGDSAKMLYLSATAESMTFNADGTPNPSSQVITLTANLQNVSGNASFAATAYNGSTVVSNVALSGVGNTRTFNQAQFPASANRVQVRATLGNLVDTVTIVKLANGSNGQNAVVGLLTNESITLPANKDGLVSSFTGATGVFDVYDGITKKTGLGVKYSLVNNSQSNITVNINATTGAYSVTAMPTGTTILNGFATLSAIYNGVTIEKQLNVSKSVTGATGASGKDGIAGKDGKGISSTTITYGLSTTDTVEPTSYTSNVPTLVKGRYLWTKTVWKYTDTTTETGYTKTYIAKDGNNGTDGIAGKDGVGIKSTSITYVGSTSGTVTPTSGWTTAVPTVASGSFLWTRTIWTYTDNTTETGYSVARMGSNGATGATGAPGASATSYWITASNNIIGKSQTGVINPTTITFKGFSKTGTANSVAYSGRFIVQTSTNGTTYTTRYTSSADQNTYTYTIPSDSLFVKCLFYMAGGTTILLDEQTVPIVESAEGIQVGGEQLMKALNDTNYTGIASKTSEYVRINGQNGASNNFKPKFFIPAVSGEYVYSYKIDIPNIRVLVTLFDDNKVEITDKPVLGYTWNVYYKGYFKDFYGSYQPAKFTIPAGVSFMTVTLVIINSTTESPINANLYWHKLEKGNIPTDWRPHPEDARTYKAWANSADGGADFTRVYPNENLISKADITTGGFLTSTGAFSANTAWFHTDYIPVAGMTKLVTSGYTNLGSSPATVYYNSDKAFVKGINNNGQSLAKDITIDSGIEYIRFSGETKDLPTLKLEQGTTPTIYTTNPQDSLSGSMPKYVGFSPLDSDDPKDYTWILNPDYAENSSKEYSESKIEQTSTDIMMSVTESFVGSEEFGTYIESVGTQFQQTADDFNFIFKGIKETIDGVAEDGEKNYSEIQKYIRFEDGNIILGSSDSDSTLKITKDEIAFMQGGDKVAYFSGQSFYINKGILVESMQVGEHRMTRNESGHTSFDWIG